jgi:hypothetical protein
MRIGDTLIHDGRRYVILGFDPEGVTPRMVYAEDAEMGPQSAAFRARQHDEKPPIQPTFVSYAGRPASNRYEVMPPRSVPTWTTVFPS